MSNSFRLSVGNLYKKEKTEEEKILSTLYEELSIKDILNFNLNNKKLGVIFNEMKPFEKKFVSYQRYNFNLEAFSKEFCSLDSIIFESEKSFSNTNIYNNKSSENKQKTELKNEKKEKSLNKEEEKKKMINNELHDGNAKTSEILEKIMNNVNIFEKIEEDEKQRFDFDEMGNEMFKNNIMHKYLSKTSNNNDKKSNDKNTIREQIFPIDMINKIENEYEDLTINKIKKDTQNIDLYPLDTYIKENELNVKMFQNDIKSIQYDYIKQNMDIKEIIKEEKKDIFTVMTVDKPNQEPGLFSPIFLYICTSKGKIIKILLNNKSEEKEIEKSIINSQEDAINCIEVYDKYMVTGHGNGTILIWEDLKIIEKFKNEKVATKILYLKLIKLTLKKIELLFSDTVGNVYYLKRAKGLISSSTTTELIYTNEYPIYKISIFSNERDLKIMKKKKIVITLTSCKGVSILKIRPKPEKQDDIKTYIKTNISLPYGKIGEEIFDCDLGFGFPPMSDKIQRKSLRTSMRESMSDSIIVGQNDLENSMFIVSFGKVIQLFDIKLKKSNKLYMCAIGHYINDKSIIKVSFLTNSFIAIITNDYCLKIVNTFDFEKDGFTVLHEPNKNGLVSYEIENLNNLKIIRQNNVGIIDNVSKTIKNYYIYLNTVVPMNKSILILGQDKLCQFNLLGWDTVISNLKEEKKFEKMLWLGMVVLNKNKNLLTIQSGTCNQEYLSNYKYKVFYTYLINFLIEIVSDQLKNGNSLGLRMFIEFCLGADFYDIFYVAGEKLLEYGCHSFLYEILTKYILNEECKEVQFEPAFLGNYIKYYVEKQEKLLLSQILLRLNIFALLKPEIISLIQKYELINTFIYVRIKEIKQGKVDYFQPIKYLHALFMKGLSNKDDNSQELNDNYFKLITENDIKLYNDNIITCHDFLGHKYLWYCNKVLSNEQYYTNLPISQSSFKQTVKKILFYLTLKENMEQLLNFDSYSYFQVIRRFFIEKNLFQLIHRDAESNEDLFSDIKEFLQGYLYIIGIESTVLTDKYFYYEIKSCVENQINNYYMKYDFYKMISIICSRNGDLHLDRASIKDAIIYFITYDIENSPNYDKFNCHKKPENFNEYKEKIEILENNALSMLKFLESNQELTKDDTNEILSLSNIDSFRQIKMFLLEVSRKFNDCFMLHIEEFREKDKFLTNEQKIDKLFKWIEKILRITLDLENKKIDDVLYHKNFKNFLLLKLNLLSDISLKKISEIIDKWYKENQEDVILTLNDENSLSLQFKYINHYLKSHTYDPDKKDGTYSKFLLMKINLLIKTNHKEQILGIIHLNRHLCNTDLLKELLKKDVNDACIFIYTILDNIDEGLKLTLFELHKLLNELKEDFTNILKIQSKTSIIRRIIELGLGLCQKSSITRKTTLELVEDYWLPLTNEVYKFQIDFAPILNQNKNNINTANVNYINNCLNEYFELIIGKMTDFIPLRTILDTVGNTCRVAGVKKFQDLIFLMFANYNLISNEYLLLRNIAFYSVENEMKNYIKEYNCGHFFNKKICDFCKKKLANVRYLNYLRIFYCNHVYHRTCVQKFEEINNCFVCKNEDISFKKEEDQYNDTNEKMEEMMEEELEKARNKCREEEEKSIKLTLYKQKLNRLKKLRNKRKEVKHVFHDEIDEI